MTDEAKPHERKKKNGSDSDVVVKDTGMGQGGQASDLTPVIDVNNKDLGKNKGTILDVFLDHYSDNDQYPENNPIDLTRAAEVTIRFGTGKKEKIHWDADSDALRIELVKGHQGKTDDDWAADNDKIGTVEIKVVNKGSGTNTFTSNPTEFHIILQP